MPVDATNAKTPDSKVPVKHSRMVTMRKVDVEQLAYLENDCIAFLTFVEQGGNNTLKDCVSNVRPTKAPFHFFKQALIIIIFVPLISNAPGCCGWLCAFV